MRAAFLDEFPLHKRKQILLGSMRPAMMKGMNQSGFILWGGTVEEGITPEQIAQLSSLVEDSKLFNFKVLFAPAWWLSLIHISEPTRHFKRSRMPSSA